MYCKFSAVSSNVVDVISILVSEIMVMNIVYWYYNFKGMRDGISSESIDELTSIHLNYCMQCPSKYKVLLINQCLLLP